MRTLTAQETAVLATGTGATWVRIDVDRDGLGTFVDLGTLGGYDWLLEANVKWGIDDPVASATVTLVREQGVEGSMVSLSPLMTTSPLNLVSGVYTPCIDVNRAIRVYTAMMPHMMSPLASDWRLVFDGYIDDWDAGGKENAITLQCRDLGSLLQDGFIEADEAYGTDAGSAVETEMQAIIDDCVAAGTLPAAVTMYTPTSPGWAIYKYAQQKATVMDALRTLAQQNGWDVRYLWRAATSQFELTFYCPDRTKVAPDLTLGPGQYELMPQAKLSRVDVRNVVRVEYNRRSPLERASYVVTDATSIARYGRRTMIVGEASTSNIASLTEAAWMGNAILADLKDPLLVATAEMPYLYALELGDLIRFTNNGVQFDTSQDLAVVSIDHRLTTGTCITALGLRGKPSGGYERWLALEQRGGVVPSTFCDIALIELDQALGAGDRYDRIHFAAVTDDSSQFSAGDYGIVVKTTGLYELTLRAVLGVTDAGIAEAGIQLYTEIPGVPLSYTLQEQKVPSPASGQDYSFEITWRSLLESGRVITGMFVRYGGGTGGLTVRSGTTKTRLTMRRAE